MPKYLKRRRQGWFLNLPIPIPLRPLYLTEAGEQRTHIVEGLHTRDQREAEARAYTRIGIHKAAFLRQRRDTLASLPGSVEDARRLREAIRAADSDAEREAIDDLIATQMESMVGHPERDEHSDDLNTDAATYQRAKQWADLARAKATIREAWADWSVHNEHDAATRMKDEQALRGLMDHLREPDAAPSRVTHAVARDYVRWLNTHAKSARDGEPLSKATKEGRIAPLRIFWDYLEHNEHAPRGSNPWRAHKFTAPTKVTKRPYTDAELLALFTGPEMSDRSNVNYSRRTMLEVYALLFYTGARRGEITDRLLGDITPTRGGYVVRIPDSKTTAGVRSIPVLHPIPVAILRERIGKRKDPKAQLFAEFTPGGPEKSLGWYVGKAMGRYRDTLGLTAEVDTHSTRRQMITNLIADGHAETPVQWYVGHKPKGITAGVYAKPTDAALRTVAKSIKLSPKVERALRAALATKSEPSGTS
jgi:integrase